jgi:catalase
MTNATQPPPGAAADRTRISTAAVAARVAIALAITLAGAAAFAYLRGWLTPTAVTAERFVDQFERADGRHPGFRRNHAKGVGVSGHFDANGQGVRLSEAAVLRPGRVPVVGRFSLSGGNPHAADAPETVRGLGLRFAPPAGGEWRTAMIDLPVFPARTPEAFFELMRATDPEQKKAFLARHPESARAADVLRNRTVSSGFADTTFHSLNAFRFTGGTDGTVAARWVLEPEQPARPADASAGGPNFLFDALLADLGRGPLRWHLVAIVGRPDDPTDDATAAWPADRERVDVGTLTLDRAEADDTSPAAELVFDPLVLPAGIEPSDDPLLSARSAVYSRAFTRRAGEGHPRAAVPVKPEGGK